MIFGVTRCSTVESAATGTKSTARLLRYVIVNQNEKLLPAGSAMWKAEAELILVSRKPDSQRPEDLVGVITSAVLARVLRTEEDLS